MLDKAKTLLRIETALVALILAAAAAGVYIFIDLGGSRDDLAEAERRFPIANNDLAALRQEKGLRVQELAIKQQNLTVEQQGSKTQEEGIIRRTFATRREALDLSAHLIDYASDHDLGLGNFETTQSAETVGGVEFPTVSYSLLATGAPDSLIGMLDIVGGVRTAKVENLELIRDESQQALWNMTLDVVVIYFSEG